MKTCSKCGAQMAEDRLGGHCPACLMRKGLDPGHDDSVLANGGISAEAEANASGGTRIVSASPSFNEQAGERLGRYKLLQLLGEGGMGRVWMAEQTEPVRRMVALKVIKPGMDSNEVLARFEAERQALALMDHPNIARILDAGAAPNGRLYFVMDLVKGVSLIKFCDEQRLSVQERLELFMQVCQGVQHAHQKGIIHRDLKPSNVMVALYDGKPVPKVIDFGVAKATGQRLTERSLFTQLGAMLGTLEYMSPEQAEMNQLDIDTRSDIYSLGVLLYELLAGSTPLSNETLRQAAFDEVLKRIREEEPPKPSQRLSTTGDRLPAISAQRKLEPEKLTKLVQGELDWIVMKALEKERSRRYDTANAFATDLQHYLNDEPVAAGPPTARYRMKKFARKHRTVVAVTASFAALLALATVVSTGLALWAKREAAKAGRAEVAAETARGRADQEARRANQEQVNALRSQTAVTNALTDMQIQRAEELFAVNDSGRAIALLASVLTSDRSNRVAAERLLSALAYGHVALPVNEPLQLSESASWPLFSRDGLRVVTTSEDNTARIWDVQTGKPLTEPLQHGASVWSASFSPNGLRVITVCQNSAWIWDAQTGKLLVDTIQHEDRVASARFSPDGLRVLTSSEDKTARVWDAQTGQPFTKPFQHSAAVRSAQFSRDGLRVVTTSEDKTARIWDVQTGKPLTEPLQHGARVRSAQFSPDGLRLITTSSDKTARIWDVQTGKPLTEPLQHSPTNFTAQFSPDGRQAVTAFSDQTVRVWDAQTGNPLTEPLPHAAAVSSAQFSPDGLRLTTTSSDKTARIWDVQTGKPLTEPFQLGDRVRFAQFSPDGLRLITTSSDKTVRVYDARTGRPLTDPIQLSASISSVQFSPEGLRVITISSDKTVRVWDTPINTTFPEHLKQVGRERPQILAEATLDGVKLVFLPWGKRQERGVLSQNPLYELIHEKPDEEEHYAFNLSPDGLRLVTFSRASAQVWDAKTGKPLTARLRHPYIYYVRFSPDGQRVVTISTSTARVWDALTGTPLTEPIRHSTIDELKLEYVVNHTPAIPYNAPTAIFAQFSPDGRWLATSHSGGARVWNAHTGEPLSEVLQHPAAVRSAEFSPDGLRLITVSSNSARIWDVQTGRLLVDTIQHEDRVASARFSPDGLRVLTSSEDKTARLWDARTGKAIAESLRHETGVRFARFSPDGLRVVTAGTNNTARVWDAQTGNPLADPLWHEGEHLYAQFGPDGLSVITTCVDRTTRGRTARVWDIPFGVVPVPPWLPELAVSVAGMRLTDTGVMEPVPRQEFLKLKEQLLRSTETNYCARWARWFCSDPVTRTISPLSSITVPEYVQRRIEENTVESLNEAVRLAPTNGLAFARLAKQVLAKTNKDNPRRVGEADFFSRYALKWSPNNPEVARIRKEIEAIIQNAPKP